jgi:hypothetical protein
MPAGVITEISAAFVARIFLLKRNMRRLVKYFFISAQEENRTFELIRGIVVLLLVLGFQGAIVYVMISSLS